jgi:collagen type III alpha
VPSTGKPSWAVSSSSALPTLPSAGALPGGPAPRLDAPSTSTGSIPRVEANGAVGNSWLDRAGAVGGSTARMDLMGAHSGSLGVTEPVASVASAQGASAFPGSPSALSGPASAFAGSPAGSRLSESSAFAGSPAVSRLAEPSTSDPSAHPVSPAPLDGSGATIAETTVIPALAAVVKGNAGRRGGVAPVSPAADGNPHPAIPPAPTGIRFAVPPGWPVPPSGWYPPAGWRPDPSWPLAPSGWQWWVPTWD